MKNTLHKILYFSLSGLFSITTVFPSFEHRTIGAFNASRGLVHLNFTNNTSGIFSDPVSLTNQHNISVSFVVGRKFQLKSLSHRVGNLILPSSLGHWGIGVSSLGNKLYSETQATLGWGKAFNRRFKIGASLHYYEISISNYGSDIAYGLSLGWQVKLAPKIEWGVLLKNINRPTIGQRNEELPQLITIGLFFPFHPQVTVQTEWEQDTIYEGQVKFGINFSPISIMEISAGYSTDRVTFGGGINLKRVSFYYAMATHPYLSSSHWVDISIPISGF